MKMKKKTRNLSEHPLTEDLWGRYGHISLTCDGKDISVGVDDSGSNGAAVSLTKEQSKELRAFLKSFEVKIKPKIKSKTKLKKKKKLTDVSKRLLDEARYEEKTERTREQPVVSGCLRGFARTRC